MTARSWRRKLFMMFLELHRPGTSSSPFGGAARFRGSRSHAESARAALRKLVVIPLYVCRQRLSVS